MTTGFISFNGLTERSWQSASNDDSFHAYVAELEISMIAGAGKRENVSNSVAEENFWGLESMSRHSRSVQVEFP